MSGGDGGESNAPSKKLVTNASTSLVGTFISPAEPLPTKFPPANPAVLEGPYGFLEPPHSRLCGAFFNPSAMGRLDVAVS